MSVVERPEDYLVLKPEGQFIHLEPFKIWESEESADKSPLIILNTPLEKLDIRSLWANSSIQVCADGGANRLYEFFEDESERVKYIPSFITGDFDSLREEVKTFYKEKGSVVIPQYGQYSSDFMKAIKVVVMNGTELGKNALQNEIEEVDGLDELVQSLVVKSTETHSKVTINVAGGIGGRFDQTIQSINQMYLMHENYQWVHIVFFTSQDVIFMARKGVTYVSYSDRTIFNKEDKIPKSGILPFGKKTLLNSEGLLYDVTDWPSEIGGNVSSSNGICGTDGFIVETTENVVINIEVIR